MLPIVCGSLAASSAGVVATLEAVQAGKAPSHVIRLAYGEERPLERTIEIAVAGDGEVTATTSALKPACRLGPGFTECWDRSVQTVRLSADAHRKLVAAIPAQGLAALPREDAVAPGAARVWVTVDAGAAGHLDVRCSLETATRSAAFEHFRNEILGLVAKAGGRRS